MSKRIFENKRKYQQDLIVKFIKVNKEKINYSALGRELNVSRQTAKKLFNSYKENGNKLSTEHKNKFNRKINNLVKEQSLKRYVETTSNLVERLGQNCHLFNFAIFHKMFLNDIVISLSSFSKYMLKNNICSPKSTHKTKRIIRKNIKELAKEKDSKTNAMLVKQIFENDLYKNVKPYKGKKDLICGYTIEIDACQDFWFNNEKYHLYIAVESKTGFLLAIHIEKEETTIGYYILLINVIKTYGKPNLILTDKRRSFWGGVDRITLMEESLNELGIELKCSSCATHKPNVERAFNTLQSFAVAYFFQKNINNLEDALKIKNEFINEYNNVYKKKLEEDNLFTKVSEDDINISMCPKKRVKINEKANTIWFEGKALAPFYNGKRYIMKGSVVVRQNVNDPNDLFMIYKNKKYELREVSSLDIFEDEFTNIVNEKRKLEFEKNKAKVINKNIRMQLDKRQAWLDQREKQLNQREKMITNKEKSLSIDT